MLQMPTGTGKTRLFASILKDIFMNSMYYGNVKRVLVMAHRTELVNQIRCELSRYDLEHGIIQSGTEEKKEYLIQVASVQTLSRRIHEWYHMAFDFIVVDEAHHITALSYQKIIEAFPNAKLLGVTATPYRLDGEGFHGYIEKLIVSPGVKEFIDRGYLSNYEYYSVPGSNHILQELDNIGHLVHGDYAESELSRICDKAEIRAQVVATYLTYAKDKKGIVYTINRMHNIHLCDDYTSHGVVAVAIDCETPSRKRREYLDAFKRGEIQVICNVNLFSEGFDCPDIEFVQLARPTMSLAIYLQQIGRGLRISPTKDKAIFLDNVGLYNRFGLPSSPRNWENYFYREKVEKNETDERREPKGKRERNLEEGNEEVRLIYSTVPERASLLPDTNQSINKKLAPILLLASYL